MQLQSLSMDKLIQNPYRLLFPEGLADFLFQESRNNCEQGKRNASNSVGRLPKNYSGEKKELNKAIRLAKKEIKEWQDFLVSCYKRLEKLDHK